jgi:hypothetical protein
LNNLTLLRLVAEGILSLEEVELARGVVAADRERITSSLMNKAMMFMDSGEAEVAIIQLLKGVAGQACICLLKSLQVRRRKITSMERSQKSKRRKVRALLDFRTTLQKKTRMSM